MHVRAVFPLAQVVQAHHEIERGHGRGKVVVTMP
ncbi:zinc-binding dehydrogenase [Frankia sp. AiPa1]|nr:zinc-binding dehydrogenase [Frankia sp. AiPa1]